MRRGSWTVVVLAVAAAAVVIALRACGDGAPAARTTEHEGVDVRAPSDPSDSGSPSAVAIPDAPRARATRPAAEASGSSAPAAPAASRRDLALTVRVLRSEDRSPIEGGRVLLRDEEGHREFTTDARGEARFEIVPGDVAYGVLADDRARHQGNETIESREDAVREFVLEPGAQAVGRVMDAVSGLPIAGAVVEVRSGGYDGWSEWRHPGGWEVGRATTGTDGRFRVPGLSRDRAFTLRAEAAGYATETRPAVAEDLGPCAADLALQPARTLRILVLDDAGVPIPEARVFVGLAVDSRWVADVQLQEARPDADGRCRVEGLCPDAVYHVTADRFDRQEPVRPGPDSVRRRVVPGAVEGEVVLRFEASAFLRVRALDAVGAPWPGAGAIVERCGVDSNADDRITDTTHVRSADGSTALRLQPGRYRVGLRVSDLRTPEPEELLLSPGEERVVEIRLPPGSLEGRIVDATGAPVEDGIVFLHGVDPPGGYACVSTGADGRFRAAGLVPGRWEMYAAGPDFDALLTEVDVPSPPREWRTVPASTVLLRFPGDAVGRRVRVLVDRKGRAPLADGAEWHESAIDLAGDVGPDATFPIQVPPCAPLRVRIRVEGFLPVAVEAPAPAGRDFDVVVPPLVPGIRIAGRVVDASGTAVPADVRVLHPEQERGGRNDDDGRFRTAAVPQGPVLLAVTPDARLAERTVRVEAREGMDPVEVVVTKGGVLDVLCTGARGVPLPGREVVVSGEGDGPLAQRRSTDARGRALFHVHPGTWRVTADGLDPIVVEVAEGGTSLARLAVR